MVESLQILQFGKCETCGKEKDLCLHLGFMDNDPSKGCDPRDKHWICAECSKDRKPSKYR